MYRHAHIRSPVDLCSLDERLSHISNARGIDAWRWVWTLFADRNQISNMIITVLTRAVNLIEANIKSLASPELLVTLRERCPSLRSLKVWVDSESHEAMAQVGLFEHVKHLSVMTRRCASNRKQLTDPLTDVPSWNMPTVTRFRWDDMMSVSPNEAMFMSRCRFPHLQHLDLGVENPQADLQGMPHICRLLDVHRNITSLRLLLRYEEHLSIIPFVRARNLWVRCNPLCHPQAVLPLLRPEVKTLEVEYTRHLWERRDHTLTKILLRLLTELAVEDDTLPTLEKIRLRSTEIHDLAPTTKERYIKVLSSHIPPLKARGIRVFVQDCEVYV
jgi:hypothetical protein